MLETWQNMKKKNQKWKRGLFVIDTIDRFLFDTFFF